MVAKKTTKRAAPKAERGPKTPKASKALKVEKSAKSPVAKKAVRGTTRKTATKKVAAPVAELDTSRVDATAIAKLALEKKASDVTMLQVRDLTSYTDWFVLATAESEPQLAAIADHLEQKMKERGVKPMGVEGARSGSWVLVDFGHVVAHLFLQETRAFYDLEGLWADAERVAVKDR